jgi:hypothetical protein
MAQIRPKFAFRRAINDVVSTGPVASADSEGIQRKCRGGEYENQQRHLVTGTGNAVGQILKTPGVICHAQLKAFRTSRLYQEHVN